jgi:tetratricopeptide (TPR) repeat protein
MDIYGILDLAEKHLEEKNYAYARDYLRRAAERDSMNQLYLNLQGKLYLMANQSKKANDLWKRCMDKYPDDVPCRISMAELQLTLGLNREALKTSNSIIELDRSNAEGFFLKGLSIRALNGDTAAAIPYFQQAVDLRNDYIEALDMLGVIYAQQKDSLALAYYRNILEIQPERSDIYFKIGVFHMQRQEWNDAMAAYERAVKINPRDADSYYNLGFVLTQIQVYDKARNSFSKAIEASPRNFKAYYGRGFTHEMLGDLSNAARDYREALGIRPKHQASALALARVKKKLDA